MVSVTASHQSVPGSNPTATNTNFFFFFQYHRHNPILLWLLPVYLAHITRSSFYHRTAQFTVIDTGTITIKKVQKKQRRSRMVVNEGDMLRRFTEERTITSGVRKTLDSVRRAWANEGNPLLLPSVAL